MTSDASLTIITFVLYIAVFIITLITAKIENIKKNWDKYRCNPIIMPFAGFFDKDPEENSVQCNVGQSSSIIKSLLVPFQQIQQANIDFTEQLKGDSDGIQNTQEQNRGIMASITSGIFGRFNNILITVDTGITAMKDVMNRIVGMFVTFMYTFEVLGDSMLSVGAMVDNVLSFGTCFDENTKILTKNGTYLIKDIKPGMLLADGSQVTGVFKLNNKREILYNLDNILVTGTHTILYNNKWIEIKDHPDAIKLKEINKPIYCLNTTNKTIKINNHIFGDYDNIHKEELNHLKTYYPNITFHNIHTLIETSYDPNTHIQLLDKTYVKIKKLKLGNILLNNDIIIGIVKLLNNRYHILTNTGTFIHKNNLCNDYNYDIEQYFKHQPNRK
tara:strand:- start:724 stop:1884 length:1161 start_codon:yes stop_codon:yes gene_type:complete